MYPGGQVISGEGAIGGAGQVQRPYGQLFDKPSEGSFRKDFSGDAMGFLDNFKKGLKSNYEESKEKSDTDKYLDFMKETRDMGMSGNPMFGDFGGGGFKEVAEGLTYGRLPSQTQQMLIPGQEGKKGLFSLGGAIKGGIGGFMKGGPAGALGGAAMGGFM
tara:strand:- start:433 stop:912 length:480 start_codon:yes stop_codon:yes gene_type:complete